MIIDAEKIENILSHTTQTAVSLIDDILAEAGAAHGLSLEHAAALLSVEEPALLQRIFKKAGEVKEKVFGKRIVLFAPLYLSNECVNNCLYCGFRKDNRDAVRKTLTIDEIIKEVKTLEGMGFKRILLVSGEDPKVSGVDYLVDAVKVVYENTGIRIIHLNAPPMEIEDFRRLKDSGVGVYQAFQETYHRPTYKTMHPSGQKKDYDYRLHVMDRAIEAGFEDVGIGALLGLYDYRYDALATIAHSQHLYEKFGSHAHTISVPRLRPADGSPISHAPFPVSDREFKKIIAVYRLAVPCAGVVVSTRESSALRDEVIRIGASQISAGSKTEPGGYTLNKFQISNFKFQNDSTEQFSTNDHRGLEEMIGAIAKNGFLPSLCATCYRVGRVGADFTDMTLSGNMEKFCQANALLTLQEYVLDYAKNGVRELGTELIAKGVEEIKNTGLKKEVLKKLHEIRQGKRDVFF
ncbi:MAG: [FeFe] hydrogenase H-cluster radical SAM maturase HydG [Deltaproteobacteria bacterium]|nr:[FeFe] hydrogenase H-cluster radical SAM maturase HydG [Deltaproteobacteria bacterium]